MRGQPKKKSRIFPLLNFLLLVLGAKYFYDQPNLATAPLLTLGVSFSCLYLLRALHTKGRTRDFAIVVLLLLVPLTFAEFWFTPRESRLKAFTEPFRYAFRRKSSDANLRHLTFLSGFRNDVELGYAFIPDSQVHYRVDFPNSHLPKFDVFYSIDSEGHRRCPDTDATQANLFFGDSFMFGHGLNDAQSLPARLQSLWQNRIASVNYSVPGYGPHQMLRLLETGMVDGPLKGRKPVHAYFIVIAHHPHRVSRYVGWGWQAPRYRLLPDGHPEFSGPIAPPWFATLWTEARKSFLLAKIEDVYVQWLLERGWSDDVLEENSKLVAAILKQSNFLLQRHYGIPLDVILWVEPGKVRDVIAREMKKAGIEPRWPEEIAGVEEGWYTDSKWTIPQFAHPSALAIDALAKGLYSESNVYSVTRNQFQYGP